jgi:hypothetical protein
MSDLQSIASIRAAMGDLRRIDGHESRCEKAGRDCLLRMCSCIIRMACIAAQLQTCAMWLESPRLSLSFSPEHLGFPMHVVTDAMEHPLQQPAWMQRLVGAYSAVDCPKNGGDIVQPLPSPSRCVIRK